MEVTKPGAYRRCASLRCHAGSRLRVAVCRSPLATDSDSGYTSSHVMRAPYTPLPPPLPSRSACVELRLDHLAVCAVINAHLLTDLGFDVAGGPAAAAAAALGGPAAAAEAFRVLRSLVAVWVEDATQRGSPYADALLGNLYRWLSAPSSRVRDPLLLRLVRQVGCAPRLQPPRTGLLFAPQPNWPHSLRRSCGACSGRFWRSCTSSGAASLRRTLAPSLSAPASATPPRQLRLWRECKRACAAGRRSRGWSSRRCAVRGCPDAVRCCR